MLQDINMLKNLKKLYIIDYFIMSLLLLAYIYIYIYIYIYMNIPQRYYMTFQIKSKHRLPSETLDRAKVSSF